MSLSCPLTPLEKENTQLHKEVEDLNGQIERLRTDM